MLPNGKKEEIKYSEWYTEHKHRLTSNAYAVKLFIPKHTELMVWYEMWQFNDDFMDYKHMWDKGEPLFHIPSGIVRCDYILSNKDVEVSMTLMSKRNEGDIPDSRIVTELNGGSWPVNIDHGSPSYEYESYGVWVKMYEQQTYIPELGTGIVAYGVMEENLPPVRDCFKHGDKQHRRLHKGPPYFAVGGNAMNPLSMKGWNINSISAHGSSSNSPTMKWVCDICGGDTSQVEYDYLGSGTNHIQCELKNHMPLGLTL
jgi:hypothetical protein